MAVASARSEYFTTAQKKKKLMDRLARIEGQLRGVQKMIAQDKDCELVAQQLAAARGGLNKAFYELIACAFEAKLGVDGPCPPAVSEKLDDLAHLLTKYA